MNLNDMSLEQLEDVLKIVTALLDYSSAAIIRNNFVKNFYECTWNGRLYGNYKLFGAKSFRLTSSNPKSFWASYR